VLNTVGRSNLTADEIRDIQDVIVATGALAELESVIDRLTHEAIEAITTANVAPDARDELVSLARYVAWREK
jgi:geranylgeranyl diphosphate synthase, type I